MCELGERLKNVGERSKARQKLSRKRGISETKLKSWQGQGQGGGQTGHFVPDPEFYVGS